jgi:acyl-CoA thioester hydrolase
MFHTRRQKFVVGSAPVSQPSQPDTQDTLAPREIFSVELVVRDDDIDPLGHASNIVFVRWIQEVALAHSSAVGLDLAAYQRLGAVFVVVRHEIDYLRPALRGDVIEARTWISDVMAAKCLRRTELSRKSDGVALARGVTTWGFVAFDSGRPKRIPQGVLTAFGPYVHP